MCTEKTKNPCLADFGGTWVLVISYKPISALFCFNLKHNRVQYRQHHQRQQRCSGQTAGNSHSHCIPELAGEHRNQSQYRSESRHHNRTETHNRRFRNRLGRLHSGIKMLLNLVNKHHTVTDNRTGERQNTQLRHEAQSGIEQQQAEDNADYTHRRRQHNNQQLAFANTIEALSRGVSYLDATVSGMGRGAGNCYMELLLSFLRNPKYNKIAIMNFVEKHILKLKEEGAVWGFDLPYLLTGILNSHPSSAIQFEKEKRTDYAMFYQELIDNTL